jgi:hypothetical protein
MQSYRQPQLWLPMEPDPRRGKLHIDVIARLKPGISLEQTGSDMKMIATGLEKQFPSEVENQAIEATGLHEDQRGMYRGFLLILLGASAALLLVTVSTPATCCWSRPWIAGERWPFERHSERIDGGFFSNYSWKA